MLCSDRIVTEMDVVEGLKISEVEDNLSLAEEVGEEEITIILIITIIILVVFKIWMWYPRIFHQNIRWKPTLRSRLHPPTLPFYERPLWGLISFKCRNHLRTIIGTWDRDLLP